MVFDEDFGDLFVVKKPSKVFDMENNWNAFPDQAFNKIPDEQEDAWEELDHADPFFTLKKSLPKIQPERVAASDQLFEKSVDNKMLKRQVSRSKSFGPTSTTTTMMMGCQVAPRRNNSLYVKDRACRRRTLCTTTTDGEERSGENVIKKRTSRRRRSMIDVGSSIGKGKNVDRENSMRLGDFRKVKNRSQEELVLNKGKGRVRQRGRKQSVGSNGSTESTVVSNESSVESGNSYGGGNGSRSSSRRRSTPRGIREKERRRGSRTKRSPTSQANSSNMEAAKNEKEDSPQQESAPQEERLGKLVRALSVFADIAAEQ